MIDFRFLIFMPIVIGIVLFILPESLKLIKGLLSLIVTGTTLYLSVSLFAFSSAEPTELYQMSCVFLPAINSFLILNLDGLSKLITLFIGLFGFLYTIYSIAYVTKKKKLFNYYSFFLITIGASFGAVLADNLLFFVTLWGLLGLTLYKLIKSHDDQSSATAKKTLILIGASDSILIMGIGIIFRMTGSLSISSVNIATSGVLASIAFLSLLVASFTKAGAFPFHTWVPDYAQDAPASSSAFLPASLDKLLGIYLLARICLDIFELTSWATLMLLIIGSITIITAVMMALVQHNLKKLLGYHAVSQVGYMITGLALGTPLGVAAGLFHLINNAIYKGGLFLTAGNVEKRTGKEELDDLGGLSKYMPLTFLAALVFALSISGIPPLNGFYSKWMIYLGIIEFGSGPGIANKLWMVWLILSLLGSSLTLASFVKFISGIYLGRRKDHLQTVREVNFLMWLPQTVLALLCIIFGVFAANWIVPSLFGFTGVSDAGAWIGEWPVQMVSILILISIIVGFIIYWIGTLKTRRTCDSFIGGEQLQEEFSYSSVEFYKTIAALKFFAFFYDKAQKKWFDIYYIGKGIVLGFSSLLSWCHSGILSTYMTWMFAGITILFIILLL